MALSIYLKYIVFILLLCFPFIGFAQDPLADSLKKCFTKTQLKNWQRANRPEKYSSTEVLYGEFNKDIGFIRLFNETLSCGNNCLTAFGIFALFNQHTDSIIYMKGFRPSLRYLHNEEDKNKSEIVIPDDTLATGNFLQWYNVFYETQKSIDMIIEELMQEEYYGYVCSDAGSPTKQILELSSLKKKKDKRKLLNEWLRSANPELQTYGIEELKRLKVKLTAKEQEIISFLQGLNVEIRTCRGCFIRVVQR